ncbi:MAG: hypothetical protein MI747_08850 [Desulfobacterales bacterium]|nr:hypothetical protein [Desulfobacterales bacterium]
MTGISEILFLIFLIAALLILPRMFKSPSSPSKSAPRGRTLGKRMRLAIVASFLYPLVAAGILKPWQGQLLAFAGKGILPVILFWALIWILSAPKK